ncbi:unnamed protein product [Linum trigynum]|uniref:Uncharacterized protein n=1 Tax=Linum trigynum TaxID=586398 RepID=A0AAV2CI84_9ROSI
MNSDAMKALPLDYPSIIARPATTIPCFKKPPGISLFYTVFSRFSDTFVFLIVALLSYSGLVVTATIGTQTSLGRNGRIFFLGFLTGLAYPFIFLYFHKIHQWRKTEFAQRVFFSPPGIPSQCVGFTIKMGLYLFYVWGGVYSSALALTVFFGILMMVSMYLSLRPAFDYYIIDSSLSGLCLYVLLAKRDVNGDADSMVFLPWLVGTLCFLIVAFRHYFEGKANKAENPEAEAVAK